MRFEASNHDRTRHVPVPVLRAGFEASGSGRWLMQTIVLHALDQVNGFRLQVQLADDRMRAGLQATESCLVTASADVVDTDWLSIARCRRSGVALAAAVPYGAIFGGLVAPLGQFTTLSELPGRRIGVIHPQDKNWLLLRAACRVLHDFDPDDACVRVDTGSKTASSELLVNGSLDAALLYWHQIPALVASGQFVEVCDLLDVLPVLGVPTVPSTFFVFSNALLDEQPGLVLGFAQAVSAAVSILRTDLLAWCAVTGLSVDQDGTQALRAKWLARISSAWDSTMQSDLHTLARCLGENNIPEGVFAPGFL